MTESKVSDMGAKDKDLTQSAEVGSRMRQLRGDESRLLCAARFNIHQNSLYKYEKGKRQIPTALIFAFAEAYGVETNWLLTGIEPKERQASPPPDRGMQEPDGGRDQGPLAGTPLLEIPLRDNAGRYVSEDRQRMVIFPRSMLASVAVPLNRLCAMIAPGRLNEPEIGDGDLMLIDMEDLDTQQAGFFVFSRDGALMVRWVEPDLRGGLILKGSPSAKTAQIVERTDIAQVTVFGRVVWRGGAM